MKNENVKLGLKAVGWGMAGALTSSVVFPIVSYLIARIFFPAALKNAAFADQLWFNPMTFMAAVVLGLGLVLRNGPPLARSIAGGLCLWIGFCTTIIPALFVVTITWRYVAGLPIPPQNMGDPLAFVWAIMFPTVLLGFMPLRVGWNLYDFRFKLVPGVVRAGFKATFWPNRVNKLQDYSLRTPLSCEAFVEKIRERTEIAQNPVSRALLLPLRNKKEVIATIKRNALVLVNGKSNAGFFVRAKFQSHEGATLIELCSVPQLWMKLEIVWFYGCLSLATIFALFTSVSEIVTKGSAVGPLVSALFFPFAWYFCTSIFRFIRFFVKRQEEFIVQWMVSNLDCHIVGTSPAKFRLW